MLARLKNLQAGRSPATSAARRPRDPAVLFWRCSTSNRRFSTQNGKPLSSIVTGSDSNEHRNLFRLRDKYSAIFPSQVLPSKDNVTKEQMRQFLNAAAAHFGITTLEGWYRVLPRDFAKIPQYNRKTFFEVSGFSLATALEFAYPEHAWQPWRFEITPRGYWQQPQSLRRFFEFLRGDKPLESLYTVSVREIQSHGAGALLPLVGWSMFEALKRAYPEHRWDALKFRTVPKHHWKSIENQRHLFDSIASELKMKRLPDDWYSVTIETMRKFGAWGIVGNYYNSSVYRALQAIYPEHAWDSDRFLARPVPTRGARANQRTLDGKNTNIVQARDDENPIASHRALLEQVAESLGLASLDGWYDISIEAYERAKVRNSSLGAWLKRHYGGSLARALRSNFPEFHWEIWKFDSAFTTQFWDDAGNQREFLESVAKKLNFTSMDDWYRTTTSVIVEHGGSSLLARYNSSLARALIAVFPEHQWQLWRFENSPVGYWYSVAEETKNSAASAAPINTSQDVLDFIEENQTTSSVNTNEFNDPLQFLDDLAPTTESSKQVSEGTVPPSALDDSIVELLDDLDAIQPVIPVPTHVAPPQPAPAPTAAAPEASASAAPKLNATADAQAKDPHYALRGFIEDIGARLGVKRLDDWYRVSQQQLLDEGAAHILPHFGGIHGVLKLLYPQHRWNARVLSMAAKRAVQRQLRLRLEALFPGEDVIEEYSIGIKYVKKGKAIIFDAYVPLHKLAFEYQGEVHFRDIQVVGQRDVKRDNDAEKAAVCRKNGLTLIEVPYTWDTTEASLVELIRAHNPDLFKDYKAPSTSSSSSSSSQPPSWINVEQQ